MVPLYYLSLTCRSTPHRGAHKKAVLPIPGLFIERSYAAVLFNNLCRKQREPDLHCINEKKPGYPNNRCYCFTRPQILRTLHPTNTMLSEFFFFFFTKVSWINCRPEKRNFFNCKSARFFT